jgi:cation diffusion facilitator CzcD-associated flavoprotein CzcO
MIEIQAEWRKERQPAPLPDAEARLAALAARAAEDMERIEAFGRPWASAPEPPDLNVAICGAGMSGLTLALGLKRHGVEGVALLDRRPPGAEGPWLTSARMKTLRSPKHLAGPDLGVPSLTPRAWFEAVYGAPAWTALERIDRRDWAAYLDWFRRVTRPVVYNQTRLVAVEPDPFGLALRLEGEGAPARLRCRNLVVATGPGAPRLPDFVGGLPKAFWTHSGEPRPGPELKGRDVLVLGAGASSVDWAVTALEAGARRVELLVRAPRFSRTEVLDWSNFPGFLEHFAELDDARRWRFAELYFRLKQPPTQDQFDRARAYPQFRARLGQAVRDARVEDGRLKLRLSDGQAEGDHLLLGSGYDPALDSDALLKPIAPLVRHWRDHAPADAGPEGAFVAAHPYLGPGFELLPQDPARDGWVSRIHLYTNAAIPSLGPISNGLTGLKSGAPRLVRALGRALFRERADAFAEALAAYGHPHFDARGLDAEEPSL